MSSPEGVYEDMVLTQPYEESTEEEESEEVYSPEFNKELYRVTDQYIKKIGELWDKFRMADTRYVIKALKNSEYIEAAADYHRFMKQYKGTATKELPYDEQVDIWVHRAHFMKTICSVMSDRDPMIMQWCTETIDGHLEGLESEKEGADEVTWAFQAAGFQTMFWKIYRNWPKDSREIFPDDIRVDIK